MVDARLPDGSRVNAIIPPLAIDGPILSIRRFAVNPLSIANLLDYRSLTPPMVQVLQALGQAKVNILISGGTGSGKTTMLNVLSGFIPRTSASSPSRMRPSCAAPAARGAAGNAAAEYRRQGRSEPALAGAQRAAHAARPHHPRRGARAGSAGHAAGDEHRPRRLAGHHPLQHAARCAGAAGEHGRHGRREPDAAPRASRSVPP
jgi:energy-coupling factor transporter ATP-binding protein EcfA2